MTRSHRPTSGDRATLPRTATLLVAVGLAGMAPGTFGAFGGSAAPLGAQEISGWVVEQVWAEPVEDAEVFLFDAELAELAVARTDGEGRFRLRAPGPGTYLLQARKGGASSTLSHEIAVADGVEADDVVLEFPSPLVESLATCYQEDGDDVESALVGVAFHAETGIALPGARVVLEGGSREAGTHWRAETRADEGGRYHFCAVPVEIELTAWGHSLGQVSRPLRPLTLEEGSATRVDLALELDFPQGRMDVVGTTILGVPDEQGALAGRLVDAVTGGPVANAVVRLGGTTRQALTDEGGGFRFGGLEAGIYTLEVEHLAYGAQQLEIDLPPASDVTVELRVSPQVLALDGIEVIARPRQGDARVAPIGRRVMAGEELRRVEDRGGSVTSVVRTFPGLRIYEVEGAGMGATPPHVCIESSRRVMGLADEGCQMIVVVIDGVPLSPESASDYLVNLPVHEFESIEFLRPLEAGFEYGLDASAYGALVLWTRGRGPHVSQARER